MRFYRDAAPTALSEGGIDEGNVPPHQFGKGRLRPVVGVIAQKLFVGQTVHSWNSNRRRLKRTGKRSGRPEARRYGRLEKIHFDGAQFRRDIAAKALK